MAAMALRNMFCRAAANANAAMMMRPLSSFPFRAPPAMADPPPPAEPSPKLFVNGLARRTTSEGLRTAFEKFGSVLDARVITDRVTGASKCFGFVTYATQEEAEKGREGMDGKFLDGFVIFAEYARPRAPRNPENSDGTNSTNFNVF